ncbi:hypothetical protein A4D02_04155 [Niastella koreensis]|uniref:Uncharacterized protein n=2 Tax=Niastella koreensis TaxID=354356 RepID=G8TQG1_NIAKG|nr:hypothetical protein [Niastella koreensis]AEW03208.1 hypothetical protein Niako_6987 [Niastella koreensis GR20-10]OQP55507.1 hypothetical protein A4D02_04155 [Niastella koreensis]
MKTRLSYIPRLFLLCMICCKTPIHFTANPDDQTNANGTLGSAKMTNQLPPKSNNVRLKPDTIRLPNDTTIIKHW